MLITSYDKTIARVLCDRVLSILVKLFFLEQRFGKTTTNHQPFNIIVKGCNLSLSNLNCFITINHREILFGLIKTTHFTLG